MYTKVGFIENFDKKGSYPQFGKVLSLPILKAETIKVEASKPIKILNFDKIIDRGRIKRAKHQFKVSNPNHKDKVLAIWN